MSSSVAIVMYHYVRDVARTRFPRTKALSVDEFRGQLGHLTRHYCVVSIEELVAAARDGTRALPPNAALLTFDDGYLDHYATVLPLVLDAGVPAAFFPPALPVLERRVLQVNKIQFVLAAVEHVGQLVEAVMRRIDAEGAPYGMPSADTYWEMNARATRFDSPSVVFVKAMLQRELPEELRRSLVADLFARFVTSDEAAFAAELYVDADQLRTMVESGMYVGSHGYHHEWMDRLTPEDQRVEVDRSLTFLDKVGAPTDEWVMCYPYGAYDESLLGVLRQRNCAVGLTSRPELAKLGTDDRLVLPRLDTNDLPTADI
ncbi:MAG: polysaccharide deacetylase family protein [Acidimicrobiales bacterium]